ncbi:MULTISPECIES: hypothetical protein [Flavobacterium]|uniref:Uncharacterized protein n=1 Tax=Flavobacterium hankyongi TaxID=1176532 RepID=A0ABP8ZKU5_9FLAO|nr:hypothetical protein [Flavobacterium sp. N1846]
MNNFIEPYYLVDFNSSICNFDIYINDLPAFIHNVGGSIFSHYPINHLILGKGLQKIRLRIKPLKTESKLRDDGFVKIKVFYYDSSTTDYENVFNVFKFETPDLSKSEYSFIEYESTFDSVVNYELRGWKSSLKIEEEDYKNEIIAFYKKIYELFRENNVDKISFEMLNRFEETDIAMYLQNTNNKKELEDLIATLKNDNFIIESFPQVTTIQKFANSCVINLVRENGLPIIYYKNQNNEEFSYPILIHKIKNKQVFEIIR